MKTKSAQLLSRFEGAEGPRRLLAALKTQKLAGGSDEIAKALAAGGEVMGVDSDASIIEEGAAANDLFLVLAGSFSIRVNGTEVAIRHVGDHVGEQALMDPSRPRSASVVAVEAAVVFKIDEPSFDRIANTHPGVWKTIARELSVRLIQRNRLVRNANEQVQVFIISASESLHVANEVRVALNSRDVLCTVWTDGVFKAGTYALEALELALGDKDFAIAVASPDDFLEMRGKDHVVPRDNVVFELGLFIGRIGRERTILMESRDEDIKLPSDLIGLTTVPFKSGSKDRLPVLLGGPCQLIRRIIDELGPIA